MGLENLKSIFSNIEPINKTNLSKGKLSVPINPSFTTPSLAGANDFTPTTNNDNIIGDAYSKLLDTSPLGKTYKNIDTSPLYMNGSNITPSAFPFSLDGISKSYENQHYDPRPSTAKQPYKGTTFTDNLGGIFNQIEKYSTVFRNINTPKFIDIVTSGNINTAGVGYPRIKNIYQTFDEGSLPDSYKGNGRFNVDASRGSWYVGTNSTIPNLNELNSFETGVGKRTIIVGSKRYEGNRLGKGDLKFESLYHHNHKSKSDDRLNIRYQGDSRNFGMRNWAFGFIGEPYNISSIPKSRGEFWRRKPGRGMPIIRYAIDALRLIKYNTSPMGLLNMAANFIKQSDNLRSHRSLSLGLPALQMPYFSVFPYHTKADKFGSRLGNNRSKNEYTDSLEEVGGFDLYSMGNMYQVLGTNAKGKTSKLYVSGTPYLPNRFSSETSFARDEKQMPVAKAGHQGTFGGLANLVWEFNPRTLMYQQNLTGADINTRGATTGAPSALTTYAMGVPSGKQNLSLGDYSSIPSRQSDVHSNLSDSMDDAYWHAQGKNKPFATIWDSLEPRQFLDSENTAKGDWMTLQPVSSEKSDEVELTKHGMPVYFKDLRDNRYIIFRGFVEGITESLNPTWTGQSYIGRSEKAYTYSGAERDVSFTLRMMAQTADELTAIYGKLERLHGLAYPSYENDVYLEQARMKPPLMEFRLGELFGSAASNMSGFFKSLSFTYIDTSPWETVQGRRVPKQITAAISITVIHKESVPDWATQFLGISNMEEQIGSYERVVPVGASYTQDNAPYVTGLGGGPFSNSKYKNRTNSGKPETNAEGGG